ncbi:hypothetical protein DMB92_03535 [Campylobacter sp. MIT 99-7217]|uniref:hypothetical protein n=1 Tax=Campylobacter sp. MIT 99-7217 TaxID=535091 RepID=UPI00115A46A1|nr:hypothetical protein [Campylobacter sp. MIT 99-7217]TQR33042.1 hypothetical protein DMB92_03535 [Campylobacter sp. MIT 99-7217]
MAKFFVFIILVLLLFALSYALRKRLRDKIYYFFFFFFGVLIIVAVLFELRSSKEDKSKEELILAFFQGSSLKCKDIHVSKENFNFDYGTSAFIANDKNASLKFMIFNARDCELE